MTASNVRKALSAELAKKIVDPKDIEKWALEIRQKKKKIVTLNGSFDLLHAGHLFMIYEASRQGDVLMVALNSDSSIKAYKSADRPIISLEARLEMMAALGFVDYVTWFDETDPKKILSVIKPDIHVNGMEYGENCIEGETVRQNGGKIYLVPRIEGLSTSKIIEKIKKLR